MNSYMDSNAVKDNLNKDDWHSFQPVNLKSEVENSYDLGFKEGYEKAKVIETEKLNNKITIFEDEINNLLIKQNNLIETLTNRISDETITIRSEIFGLCQTIISKILTHELKKQYTLDPKLIEKILHDIIHDFLDDAAAEIYINENSFKLIEKSFQKSNLTLKIDNTLSDGDFYIKQGDSFIDGTLASRIDQALQSGFSVE